jgi:hypothetical protein
MLRFWSAFLRCSASNPRGSIDGFALIFGGKITIRLFKNVFRFASTRQQIWLPKRRFPFFQSPPQGTRKLPKTPNRSQLVDRLEFLFSNLEVLRLRRFSDRQVMATIGRAYFAHALWLEAKTTEEV